MAAIMSESDGLSLYYGGNRQDGFRSDPSFSTRESRRGRHGRVSVLVRIVRVRQALGARNAFGSGDLPGKVEQHGAQVLAKAEQIHRAITACDQEREDRLVCLQRVAVGTGENEIVAAIIGSLAAAWRHVIERDRIGMNASLAVRTYGTMAVEQPLTRVRVSGTTCWQRGVLLVCSRGTAASARGWAGATQWYKGLEGD